MNGPKDPPDTRMVGVRQAAERSSKEGNKPIPDTGRKDAPGKPKSASSRQQMHPHQGSQTGSAELDGKSSTTTRQKVRE